MLELHKKYGHVVRIAPNEVSFDTAESLKDIYNQRAGHQVFIKGVFYEFGSFATGGITSIISERRPEAHKEMRNHLTSAFSERAILEQEEIVASSVDKLIRLVGTRGSSEKGVDMSTLFESMTFDIVGDLAFGETFEALDNGKKRHPWIRITLEGLKQGVLLDVFSHSPTIASFLRLLLRSELKKGMENCATNEKICYEAIKRRIAKNTDRKDFYTRILEERDPKIVSDKQLAARASDLVIAGSSTTATSLAATLYYLLQNPSSLEKLRAEVRSTFNEYADITYSSTQSMEYLRAVILEGLRIYPPVPLALPRIVPDGGDTVDGYFLPGGVTVSTNPFAACLSPSNFRDPWSFNPERWVSPDSHDILESSQPWLIGPRSCIGRNMAWLELRTTLVKLIWAYDLELTDPSQDWHRESRMVTLWQLPPLMIRAKNRGVKIE
ncbi:benzoate 4-monooxygenase cytochrome P450 [Hypoxylon sp. NC1633]|nr:benzoate 4-monooxygenase cytochrome P450 [Hypoxylon sp. NC1633]